MTADNSSGGSGEDLSVTRWLSELKSGDDDAAARLWKYLRRRLLSVSRKELSRASPQPAYDEDDVAQSAFYSLCTAIQEGRYEQLEDRDQLWRLLAMIAVNKAKNRARNAGRIRRGGERTHVADGAPHLQSEVSPVLPGDDDLMMREECDRLLGLLRSVELQHVALLKVEGYTNEEVADRLACSRRSVQRRLNMIRELWAKELR